MLNTIQALIEENMIEKEGYQNFRIDMQEAWRTDELFLKVKEDVKYFYALMDDETRFWIAQQVGDTKYTANINPLLNQGKNYR